MPEIQGTLSFVYGELKLSFECDNGMCTYTVSTQPAPGRISGSTRTVPQAAFLKALAIAVHNDGMPDYREDYPDAESVQPSASEHRWIP